MKKSKLWMTAAATALVLVACKNSNENPAAGENQAEVVQGDVYEADLQALNSEITGAETSGKARFVVANDTMTVTIDVQNAPAGIEHWQHFHGFPDGADATVATEEQDANGDGIVDVAETGAVSGTTMVPFNAIPSAMNLPDGTYPVADANGSYHYEVKIPMAELNEAFAKAFDGGSLDLDKRVLYIHGVPTDTQLPSTVASVGDIPASVTLPIAVGKITKK